MIPETTLAYLAGIVDGEGHVSITREDGRYKPKVYVGMTSKDIILLLHRLFRGNVYETSTCTGKPLYRWHLTKSADLQVFLTSILPYMIEKKRQAEVVLELVERIAKIPPHHPKLSEQELTARFVLYTKIQTFKTALFKETIT